VKNTITIGSRGSRLALSQTDLVADVLRAAAPGASVRVEVISTKGDRIMDRPLAHVGGKRLFTKEIEGALLNGRIDLAVHSMKDLPTDLPEGLAIGAIPARGNPYDALVSASGTGLDDLPEGAVVGTSSVRRGAQLRVHRPDLNIVDLRGNVDTRLRRVAEGGLEAVVVACAGLERLGRADAITEVIPPEVMLPAPGQGALAIEIRADDVALREVLRRIEDRNAEAEVTAERALLAAMGGGCRVPIGALARVEGEGDALVLAVCVCSPDGERVLRTTMIGTVSEAAELGRRAARALLAEGAEALIASVQSTGGLHGLARSAKKVVVTRARAQAGELVRRLEDWGAAVFEFPTIEICPPEEPVLLAEPETYDWLILTSANAADMFFKQLAAQGYGPQDLVAEVCAIGPATAEVVRERGIRVDLMPKKYVSDALCAALLDREPNLRGKRVLLPRSDVAHRFLPEELRNHGADVTELVVYRTVCPAVCERSIAALMDFAPDVVAFTSSSAVRHFCRLLGTERLEAIKRVAAFASIGPVTSKTAGELGLNVTIEPGQHDIPGLVEAIMEVFRD